MHVHVVQNIVLVFIQCLVDNGKYMHVHDYNLERIVSEMVDKLRNRLTR